MRKRAKAFLIAKADGHGEWRNRIWETLPRRQRLLLALAHPVQYTQTVRRRLGLWATLPGDCWYATTIDRFYVVHAVKPRRIRVLLVSGQILHAVGKGYDISQARLVSEWIDRDSTHSWWPANSSDRRTLRMLTRV